MKIRFLTFLVVVLAGLAPLHAAEAPHVFFLIGEMEYDTRTTLPAFAKAELEPRGVRSTFSILPTDQAQEFPNLDAIETADVLLISVRRKTPPRAQMDAIRAYIASGKPVVGIRTASHAFALRAKPGERPQPPAGHTVWPGFDSEILGGNYDGHFGKGIETWGRIVPAQAQHPVLAGIGAAEFRVPSHLYKNPGLPAWVTPLMTARLSGHPEVEPIAWVNTKDGRRVFYTSLGAVEDFAVPQFRRLLLNGIFWALNKPVPAKP